MSNPSIVLLSAALCLMSSVLLAAETAATAKAADTLVAVSDNEAPYVITAGRLTVTDMQLDDTLDVMLNSHGHEIAAFDLTIAVDNPMVSIDTVLPGLLVDSCRWQYFISRPVRAPEGQERGRSVWQVIALAEMVHGDTAGPICFNMEIPASLIRPVCSSPPATRMPDTVVPIFFYWLDCTDNTLATRTGDTLLMSARVFDSSGEAVSGDRESLPGRTGSPDGCIRPTARNRPQRRIDFYNGAIEFRLDMGTLKSDSVTDSTK